MSRKRHSTTSFGVFIATGVFVFLLGILGIDVPTDDTAKHDTEKVNTQSEVKPPTTESEIIEFETTESEIIESETITSDSMKVHFLDVDQGLAILVQLGDEVLIYDGGERDTSSFVVAYLKNQGVEDIDYLISSHYDADHVSGLIGCLNAFDVEMVIGSDYVHDSKIYTSFMNAVEAEGLKMQYPAVGTQYPMGDAVITILSPKEISSDSNSNSVVIKLSYGESDFIFTGDADYKNEREMIAMFGMELDCEVLSVGHHGSASATSEKFLSVTTPEYAVISCGEGNAYGHPHKETLQYLNDFEVEILRNDELGTIVVETDGDKMEWFTNRNDEGSQ